MAALCMQHAACSCSCCSAAAAPLGGSLVAAEVQLETAGLERRCNSLCSRSLLGLEWLHTRRTVGMAALCMPHAVCNCSAWRQHTRRTQQPPPTPRMHPNAARCMRPTAVRSLILRTTSAPAHPGRPGHSATGHLSMPRPFGSHAIDVWHAAQVASSYRRHCAPAPLRRRSTRGRPVRWPTSRRSAMTTSRCGTVVPLRHPACMYRIRLCLSGGILIGVL